MDRRLKHLKKELGKPKIPFEQWAAEHDVDLTPPQKTRRKWGIKRWVLSTLPAFALVLVVGLPVAFHYIKPASSAPGPSPPAEEYKRYSSTDVNSTLLTEISDLEKLFLIDFDCIESFGKVLKDNPHDDPEKILSYQIREIVVGFTVKEVFYAFKFNYRVRIYKNYDFSYYERFDDLSKKYNQYSYKIDTESFDETVAYITFEDGANDYYLEVEPFEGVTDVNEETVEILLEYLFGYEEEK